MAESQQKKQAEDIFAAVDPKRQKPAQTLPKSSTSSAQPAPAPPSGPDQPLSDRGKSRILLYIVIAVFGTAVVGFGAWWMLQPNDSATVNENVNSSAPLFNTNSLNSNTPASNSNQNTNPSSENRNLPIIVNNSGNDDADRDGLKDSEEAEIGTDPNLSDTDSDGLSDTQELRIYGSDPLKADSDGDGFDDGEEVASGFDPAGPGQLFDIDSETN